MTFEEFVRAATTSRDCPEGYGAYEYQQRMADEGLPDLLCVPTGAGKTLAACLPWLYRRRMHPDGAVRGSTPRRLVVVLPQRALVEQTRDTLQGWLKALDEAEPLAGWDAVGVHVLMGGASTDDREWKTSPEQDAMFVATQDMAVSRLLLRGYGEPRAAWPVSFGLLHTDTQFVFDEVQLMGPALVTSLQLQGLRERFGTAVPCRSMWMSATVDRTRFEEAPDFPGIGSEVALSDADRQGRLRERLDGTRRVEHLRVDPARYAASLAQRIMARHQSGTRTIAVLNTVDRAVDLYRELVAVQPEARLVLLHSRFRPADRSEHLRQALAAPVGAGVIVCATQVLEAGVDVTSHLLVTEVAPWSSVVQRAGRCNRDGKDRAATLAWVFPPGPSPAPYGQGDLDQCANALARLDGQPVTTTRLQELPVPQEVPLYSVLRRADMLDLFDTMPDLSGNDLDVDRWIRDVDERSVSVAWRDLSTHGPAPDDPALTREELCPAPVTAVRAYLNRATAEGRERRAWVFDQREGQWRRVQGAQLRPGQVVVLAAAGGGYTRELGWHAAATTPVVPLPPAPLEQEPPSGLGQDPRSSSRERVTLAQHLDDVGAEAGRLLEQFSGVLQLSTRLVDAAVTAARLHDVGKAHSVFQESVRGAVARVHGADAAQELVAGSPWAKSGTAVRLVHERPQFRHELAGALMLLDPSVGLLDGSDEPDLVRFLVAAHHGKVRVGVHALPGEPPGQVFGVRDGDEVDAFTLTDGRRVPRVRLSTAVLSLGGAGDSWTARVCRLRDRDDIGPFRLGFLEALVRVADWRASQRYDQDRSAQAGAEPERPEVADNDGGRAVTGQGTAPAGTKPGERDDMVGGQT